MSLRDLIEAVEAGDYHAVMSVLLPLYRACEFGTDGPLPRFDYAHVKDAFNGSLDAAKALHEALLPRWLWGVSQTPANGRFDAWVERDGAYYRASDDNYARAWLLAILRAMEAEGRASEARDG